MTAPKFYEGADFRSQKAFNIAAATGAGEAVIFEQLQAAIKGYDLKDPVRTVSVSNITLSGLQTIDGVSLGANDRHLAAGQTDQTKNGIWLVGSGAWTRALDADENAEITKGFTVAVMEGTTKGTGSAQANIIQYGLTNTTDPVVGTSNLVFAPVGASGATYDAGNGLQKSGSTFSVKPGVGLIADAASVRVDTAVVATKTSATIGNGTLTTIDVIHNLNTKDVHVSLRTVSGDEFGYTGFIALDANTVRLTFGTAPASNSLRVTVIG